MGHLSVWEDIMHRINRELSDVEIIDTFFELLDLIVNIYNVPVRPEFLQSTRAAQLGHDMIDKLIQRDILEKESKIGYDSQVLLCEHQIIRNGDIYQQERLETD